jgi:hypothetical protein
MTESIDWTRVLAQIEKTLVHSLTLAGELPATGTSAVADIAALRMLDDRLQRWTDRLAEAEQAVEQTDDALLREVRALEQWQRSAGEWREKLKRWKKTT